MAFSRTETRIRREETTGSLVVCDYFFGALSPQSLYSFRQSAENLGRKSLKF